MKQHVLMNKKTGDLLLGQRCWLGIDEPFDDITPGGYSIAFAGDWDGWLIFHPSKAWGGHWLFFNRKCEAWFENLGEL